jgi:peroxiredoxin
MLIVWIGSMPRTRTNWIILTIVAAVLGAAWIGVNRVDASDSSSFGRVPSPDIGHPAPDFALLTPGGDELALSDLRGTPVLVNFWATWCPPCRAEIPALEETYRQFDGDVLVLGVDVQENPGRVAEFMRQHDMTYPVVVDETADVARIYRVRAFPTSYLIDERGVIVKVYSGPVNQPLLVSTFNDLMGR